MSTAADRSCSRAHRFVLGLLLLAVPACGLSDYEKLMSESQAREKRFREEQIFLDKPVEMPKRKVQTEKDKEAREEPVANVFLRPPWGIESKPKPEPRSGLMWQYPANARNTDFAYVEMAFGEDDKNFADKVVNSYQTSEQPKHDSRQLTPPGQDTPLNFDTWTFGSGQFGYSVNILRSGPPIAIVYIYNQGRPDSVRKAMELSLQSLAVDQQVGAARARYNLKTPWKLGSKPSS